MSVSALKRGLASIRLEALKPRPKTKVWQWADEHRIVPAGTTSSPGRWRTSAQPCGFGPHDACTEPDTDTVTVVAATQVVKTELLINVAGYHAHQDPAPILWVLPNQDIAQDFSKERFSGTIASSPALRGIMAARSRSSQSTITHKEFPGGSIDFVGAHSPTDLASRPKRVILEDEIDKYPESAGNEGDPVKLAEERASTFWNRLKVRVCSPTTKERSRIWREYLKSDQRKCYVSCPHCGDAAPLTWARVVFDKGEDGEPVPSSAAILCHACGVPWSERERIQALKALEHAPGYGWRQTRKFRCCGEEQTPEHWDENGRSLCNLCGLRSPYNGHAGFHINKLLSARHPLEDVVVLFAEARKDPAALRVFTNTVLAEVWEDSGEKPKAAPEALFDRREAYGPEDVPDAVQVITWGTDVQGDRLETVFVGWGPGEEAWVLDYSVLYGDPSITRGTPESPSIWEHHDKLIAQKFTTTSGRVLRARVGCIDTQGSYPDTVLRYARARRMQGVFGTKGASGPRPIWPGKKSDFAGNHSGFVIGVDTAKELLFRRLEMAPIVHDDFEGENADEIALPNRPGFVHFPLSEEFGLDYFEGVLSEDKQTRKRMGTSYHVWVKQPGKRNEPLDTLVLALAARKSLPARLGSHSQNSQPHGDARPTRSAPLVPAEQAEAVAEGPVTEAGPGPRVTPQTPNRSTKGRGFLQSRRGGGGWLTTR